MTGTGSEQRKRWEPIRSQRQRWKKSCSFRLHTTRFAILMFGTVSFQCFPSSRPRRHACSGIIRGTEMLMPSPFQPLLPSLPQPLSQPLPQPHPQPPLQLLPHTLYASRTRLPQRTPSGRYAYLVLSMRGHATLRRFSQLRKTAQGLIVY